MIIFEEKDDRFYIAESKIKGAGRGIFASRNIKKDEFIFISGVLVEIGSESDSTTCFMNNYKFAADPKWNGNSVDIGKYVICPLGYAALVNHSNSREEQNVEIRYLCEDSEKNHHGNAVYWFLRDVEKDEEILGNYGPIWSGFKKKIRCYRPFFRIVGKNGSL